VKGALLRSATRTPVRAALLAVVVARTAVNGGVRVVYPFLPVIADGVGVSFATIAGLVALRSLAGMTAPLVPLGVESFGRRGCMLAACAAVGVGCLVTAGAPSATVAAAGFLLVGLGKPVFDVPMQAWFGDRVPYKRRGRVLGITELPWSFGLLATVPLSGVLIGAVGWRAPFLLVSGLTAVGFVALLRLIDSDRPARRVRQRLRPTREHVAVLAVTLLFSLASELLFVVYGRWLLDGFRLSVTAVGVFTIVVVGAELAGEGLVAAYADRLGLRRSVMLGLVGSAVAYAGLGIAGRSLVAAVALVIAWFVAFEVTICAAVPLVTELTTTSRDRLLSLMVTVIAAGRALGAVVAPGVYDTGGIGASGRVAAACVLAAAALLLRVPERARPRPPARTTSA
jgi:MFS transporter, DHA1 family, inner membrane transport protein